MELQNTVKEALSALYHHPDDAVRSSADRWLQEFQGTLDAWQVSDNLLHDDSSNLETLIFCSQTLRSKVQRDFEELPSEAFRPLRDSLYKLLKRFNKGPPKVRTQISIALAALAVHVSVEAWGGGGVVNWLSDEMKAHPEYIPVFLEVLTVLPQEVFSYKIAARRERRRQYEKELALSAEIAIGLLSACLSFDELKEQVLEAFASWLRLDHRFPASMLASHPLVHAALSCLNSEEHLEAAVNVISELIHYTVSGSSDGLPSQMPLIQAIVPRVMCLKEHLKDSSKDEDDIKAIARLFADMGESYVEMIATGSHESLLIVQALLEVASHDDYDISSMTFNFWHHLQVSLTSRESYSSYGPEECIEAERNRRLQVFRSPFELLVSLVSFRVEYPKDSENLSEEDYRDLKQTRYAVSDILVDVTEVLGGESTLKILFMKLVQVMMLLPKLPDQPQLLQTVCACIGRYSKWINGAPDELAILPPLVDILTKGMSKSEDTAAAAVLSFKYICEDCNKKFYGSLDGLFHIYHIAVNGNGVYKVAVDDSMHLVEALSAVIKEVPPEHVEKALDLLCLPAINSLQEIINHGDSSLKEIPARQLTIHIDRLGCIFRNVSLPEPIAAAIQKFWPVFKSIFDNRAWDMRTMESLCRACKYAVKTSGRFMGVTIGAMLEEIQILYQQHNQPCFLYLSSEVIKIFGSDQSCANYLKVLIEALFSHTTKLLMTIKDFTARPDVADDCFLLASRCIRYCPDLFVPSTIFSSLVDCALIGATIQHRDACKSILTFLSDVFDLVNSSTGEKYRHIINSVLLPRGPTLTRILIASFTGALPSSRIDEIAYVLLVLTRAYSVNVLEWAKRSISLIPPAALTEVEISSFLQALSDAAVGSDGLALTRTLEELSEVCRRNKSVQEIVQGALRPLDLSFTTVS